MLFTTIVCLGAFLVRRTAALQYAVFDDASASSVYGGSASAGSQRFGPAQALSPGSGYFCSAGAPDEARVVDFSCGAALLRAWLIAFELGVSDRLRRSIWFVYAWADQMGASSVMQNLARCQVVTWTGILNARRKVAGVRVKWAYSAPP